MPEGMVFSILRGSLHDGPGIRTTVFLKGCNLRCLWCHNPEGLSPAPQLAFRAHQCIGCGQCLAACPQNAHRIENGIHRVDFSLCRACGRCAACCPAGALQLYGRVMTVEQVMEPVLRDRPYYQGGGGLTLSGGEPFLQPDFALALLSAARRAGLHTCVETAGLLPRATLRAALPLVDLFLFDYKATGRETHRRLTGADNAPILQNLDWLYRQGACLRLRCPLIPDCNDSAEHFRAILALRERYPRLDGVDLMPYHDMGTAKALALGQQQPFREPTASPEQKARWRRLLDQAGGADIPLE